MLGHRNLMVFAVTMFDRQMAPATTTIEINVVYDLNSVFLAMTFKNQLTVLKHVSLDCPAVAEPVQGMRYIV
jgi:hypothetical protein